MKRIFVTLQAYIVEQKKWYNVATTQDVEWALTCHYRYEYELGIVSRLIRGSRE